MFVWTIPRSACYHSSCLAVVPFPICSSTAESVVAQYGSSLKNDHFEYIRYVQYLDSAGNPLYSLQLVGVQREAGEVTYFSHGYQCAWWSNRSNPADYYSWNTSAGNTWAWNVNGVWGPTRDIKFRANYSRSVRVPTLSDGRPHPRRVMERACLRLSTLTRRPR